MYRIPLTWEQLKPFISNSKNLLCFEQGDTYDIYLSLASFVLFCNTPNDNADFIDNYLPYANVDIRQTVSTVFERHDLTLKIASGSAVNDNGTFTLNITVPGVMANGDKRIIDGGKAFFWPYNPENKITKVQVLAPGTGTVLGTYHDSEVADENKGWFIPPIGHVEVETLGDFGELAAELILSIEGRLAAGGDANTKFYVNIDWGKVE